MRSFIFLPVMGFSAFCLIAPSPALPQAAPPIYPIVTFENMQVQSTLGKYGGAFADNGERSTDTTIYGNSLLTTFASHSDSDSVQFVPGRNDSTMWAYKLGYQLGTVRLGCGENCTYGPHVGIAIGFSGDWDPLDLTGATHITFWAKADDSVTTNVSIGLRDTVTPPASYSQDFIIDTTWKKYSIELKESTVFKLPTWVTPYPFDVPRANAIAFSISKDQNPVHADNALYLDDIEIVNWVYTPWVDPVGISMRNWKAQRTNLLQARIAGDFAVVRLPSAYLGKSGVIEALDATGRKVARASFGPQALDVSMKIAGASAKSAGLYFRAVSK